MKKIIQAVTGIVLFFAGTCLKAQTGEALQYSYRYNSECLGYNNVTGLYQGDTLEMKKSFFRRQTVKKNSFTLDCVINLYLLKNNNSGRCICFQLVNPNLKLATEESENQTNQINHDLSIPAFANFNLSGKIESIFFDSTISYTATTIFKDVISQFQFVQPTNNKAHWQTLEENTRGSFNAGYEKHSDSTGNTYYEKKNLSYAAIKQGRMDEKIKPEYNWTLRLDSNHITLSSRCSYSEIILLGNDTLSIYGCRHQYDCDSKLAVPPALQDSLLKVFSSASYKSSGISEGMSDEKITRLAYSNTLKNATLTSLMEKLRQVNTLNESEQQELLLQFRALAYLEPLTCNAIADSLISLPSGSTQFSILIQALGQAETKPASNALVKLGRQHINNPDVLMELIPYFATTTAPTEQAVFLMSEIAFSQNQSLTLKHTAQLALGGIAFHFKNIDSQEAKSVTTLLLTSMRNEPDSIQQILVFGNTGSALVLPVLTNYIKSLKTGISVKTAALYGLRLIRDNEVERILHETVTGKNKELAVAARETIAFRKDFFNNNK